MLLVLKAGIKGATPLASGFQWWVNKLWW